MPGDRLRNPEDAGGQLACMLERYREAQPIVLGLARGGIPLAAEVARLPGAPLDVVVARQLGAPASAGIRPRCHRAW